MAHSNARPSRNPAPYLFGRYGRMNLPMLAMLRQLTDPKWWQE